METLRFVEKTGKDGVLSLHIPLGKADAEFEVVIVPHHAAARTGSNDWPEDYWSLAGSIDDPTFVRPRQGELPPPAAIE